MESLTKGIPSLFSDLKHLLDNSDKKDAILQAALNMRSLMDSGQTIEGDEEGEDEGWPIAL